MTPEERAAMLRLHAAMHDRYAAQLRYAAQCELAAQSIRRFGETWQMLEAADRIASSDDGEFENRLTDLLGRG